MDIELAPNPKFKFDGKEEYELLVLAESWSAGQKVSQACQTRPSESEVFHS